MNDISIRKASLINIVVRYSSILIQILYSAVLARILTPKDFGIVAVLTVFSSFFSLLANMGIGTAVIQNKELSDNDNNSLFSFTVYLGLLLMILFSAFSFLIAFFYDNPVYKSLGAILSISLCFNILNTVPNAILLKQKRFLVVGIRTIIVTLISSIITIVLAISGLRYYSIVLHSVVSSIILLLWNIFSVRLHANLRVDWSSVKKISSYASYQFLFNITNYFARNLDSLLIGKYLGDVSLGYYNKSYTLMLFPIQNLTHVITPVLHPILSEYQNDKERIFTQYMKVVKVLSLLGIFVMPFSFSAADELILLFFGDQWSQAIPVFRLLTLSIYPQMITSSTGVIFQSLGNTKLLFRTGLITTCISIIAIIVGVSTSNIQIIAICVTIAYYLHFFVGFLVLMKFGLHMSIIKVLNYLWKDWIIMLVMFVLLYILQKYILENIIISLVLLSISSIVIYLIGIYLTNQIVYVKRILGKG